MQVECSALCKTAHTGRNAPAETRHHQQIASGQQAGRLEAKYGNSRLLRNSDDGIIAMQMVSGLRE